MQVQLFIGGPSPSFDPERPLRSTFESLRSPSNHGSSDDNVIAWWLTRWVQHGVGDYGRDCARSQGRMGVIRRSPTHLQHANRENVSQSVFEADEAVFEGW